MKITWSCFLLIISLWNLELGLCTNLIENKDFHPNMFTGEGWFNIESIKDWEMIDYENKTIHERQVYISSWALERIQVPGLSTTLLKLFFFRNVNYIQKIFLPPGFYSISALLKKQNIREKFTFQIIISNHPFMVDVETTTELRQTKIGSFTNEHECYCLFKISEDLRYKLTESKALLLSNFIINRQERRTSPFQFHPIRRI